MVTVRPTDLISRVYRMHKLVYRFANITNLHNVQMGMNIILNYLRKYNYYRGSKNV